MRKRILCYGDSNTWGFDPETFNEKIEYHIRYDEQTRWTQRVQKALGNDYMMIEEGLNGRTNVKDDPSDEQMLNGLEYLLPCLGTAAPIDGMILMLGTNDLKTRFALTAPDIAASVERLVTVTKQYSHFGRHGISPKILLIAPMYLTKELESGPFADFYDMPKAIDESIKLGECMKVLAQEHACDFLHAEEIAELSTIDYLHFSAKGHAQLANAVTKKIKEMF